MKFSNTAKRDGRMKVLYLRGVKECNREYLKEWAKKNNFTGMAQAFDLIIDKMRENEKYERKDIIRH